MAIRARGRPDRRCRAVRHRRRLPSAGGAARARPTRSWSRAARSAAPGTCSATPASARTPTCSPSATPSGRGRTRSRSPTARRSATTSGHRPRVRRREKIRFHHQVVSADWSSEDARWTVTARRTDTGETVQLTCSWLSACSGYYRYDEGFRPSSRARSGSRRGDPPAALARGLRRHRQADRRHRQRRHRGHARAEPGARRRARHDAAAHAELHPVAARPRPTGAVAAHQAAGEGRLSDRALEERAALDAAVPVQPPTARGRPQAHPPAHREAAAGGLRPRHPLQPAVRPVGPAAVPRARRRPVPHPPPRRGVDRHRPDRDLHREGHRAGVRRAPRRRRRRHRDRPQPAADGRHVAEPRRRAGRPVADGVLQGDDDLRRPQLHDGHRLHQRLLDAEGRPGQPLRLPADQPPGRRGLRVGHAGRAARGRRPAVPGPGVGLRAAEPGQPAQAGAGARRGGCTRTTSATCS